MKQAGQRMQRALESMLQTASGTESAPDRFVIDVMLAAMSGVMRSLLEVRLSPATVRKLREQLVILCQSYMAAATVLRS